MTLSNFVPLPEKPSAIKSWMMDALEPEILTDRMKGSRTLLHDVGGANESKKQCAFFSFFRVALQGQVTLSSL